MSKIPYIGSHLLGIAKMTIDKGMRIQQTLQDSVPLKPPDGFTESVSLPLPMLSFVFTSCASASTFYKWAPSP